MKNKNSIGIMQGRLTRPAGRGIQFFPFENWKQEFEDAQKLGLNEIEFIFDFYKYRQNPLWSKKGRKKISTQVKDTGVKVNSICADYFMRKPFFRVSGKERENSSIILKHLIRHCSEIGAALIEIPLVDNSSIKTKSEEDIFVSTIRKILPLLEKYNVKIGFETDLNPHNFLSLIKRVGSSSVGANYDTGNSASLGYDPKEEIGTFGEHVFNIHIKDRLYKGGTVELGKGDTQFKRLFKYLGKLGYNGSFILQTARGKDGDETRTIKSQMNFLKRLWI